MLLKTWCLSSAISASRYGMDSLALVRSNHRTTRSHLPSCTSWRSCYTSMLQAAGNSMTPPLPPYRCDDIIILEDKVSLALGQDTEEYLVLHTEHHSNVLPELPEEFWTAFVHEVGYTTGSWSRGGFCSSNHLLNLLQAGLSQVKNI